MLIDNFQTIEPLLKFPEGKDKTHFYHLQILQRKKENKHLGNNSRVIKSYYITSVAYLYKYKLEITELCKLFNARACINLNMRSFEKVGYILLQKLSNQMLNKDFYSIRNSYESVCGIYTAEQDKDLYPSKVWIVDIDDKSQSNLESISQYILALQSLVTNRAYKIITQLPTINGYHIITNPFNLEPFRKEYPTIDVHKNNPTLLYYNDESNS